MAAALRSSILWLCAVLLMLGATARADTLADIEALHKQGQTEQALQQAAALYRTQHAAAFDG